MSTKIERIACRFIRALAGSYDDFRGWAEANSSDYAGIATVRNLAPMAEVHREFAKRVSAKINGIWGATHDYVGDVLRDSEATDAMPQFTQRRFQVFVRYHPPLNFPEGCPRTGSFGPFTTRDQAEQCVLKLASLTTVLNAEVTEVNA